MPAEAVNHQEDAVRVIGVDAIFVVGAVAAGMGGDAGTQGHYRFHEDRRPARFAITNARTNPKKTRTKIV
jgi:hypothetical protein